jgi:Mg2+/Co2+ transporter CorB
MAVANKAGKQALAELFKKLHIRTVSARVWMAPDKHRVALQLSALQLFRPAAGLVVDAQNLERGVGDTIGTAKGVFGMTS